MNTAFAIHDTAMPVTIDAGSLSPDEFIAYFKNNKPAFDATLEKTGMLKFTGVRIATVDDFQYIIDQIASRFLNYIDGNSPRTKLSGNVYTSTEYDKTQKITMHNELSYSAKWPNKLFFSCILPATEGGETLLADSRDILKQMNSEIVAAIEQKGVTYIRNLHGGRGIGPSWQETFETDSKTTVEDYCRSYKIDYEWGGDDNIKIKQFSKGIITHRTTGEKLWFNQIDQFHPVQLEEELFETLKILYDEPENFPMYVRFGDGTPIQESMVKEILKTIETVTIAPAWSRNELLIVDNELVSHGRNSYTGERKVVVAMSE